MSPNEKPLLTHRVTAPLLAVRIPSVFKRTMGFKPSKPPGFLGSPPVPAGKNEARASPTRENSKTTRFRGKLVSRFRQNTSQPSWNALNWGPGQQLSEHVGWMNNHGPPIHPLASSPRIFRTRAHFRSFPCGNRGSCAGSDLLQMMDLVGSFQQHLLVA